ncbi:hypothetical protein GGS23DRAFT_404688 [Durotheca rogersii]|uniref:uncharacterized protein n=1 Tax=Durotheca rogersii TaxID=419775 RepID=UPI00221E7E44|nr:uncharacterized protein GGS23DRAFT_404688 [Durotheca rogersii]KAI5865018.1 hypothetical protein GGS23DRAFT_404688 [Durotheca rogersii]
MSAHTSDTYTYPHPHPHPDGMYVRARAYVYICDPSSPHDIFPQPPLPRQPTGTCMSVAKKRRQSFQRQPPRRQLPAHRPRAAGAVMPGGVKREREGGREREKQMEKRRRDRAQVSTTGRRAVEGRKEVLGYHELKQQLTRHTHTRTPPKRKKVLSLSLSACSLLYMGCVDLAHVERVPLLLFLPLIRSRPVPKKKTPRRLV